MKTSHGGSRAGAGRQPGSGRFSGEPLTQMRIPSADKEAVIDFVKRRQAARHAPLPPLALAPDTEAPGLEIPFYANRVAAGFPSPADDYRDGAIDLNRYLVEDASATFMVKVTGDSMINAGIAEGDILVVDRGRRATHGAIVLAAVDGQFTVKRLHQRNGRLALIPENPAYPIIEPRDSQEWQIWGVVTGCVKKF
ncbi:LexA family protein [Paludibacterium paludis]|uniref:SOS (Error prone) mutagenesis protein UmuD (RumA) n=1 Tax=Paludibacterium paludis TaxID=1225769 RepID=A0A918U908_9NEIS|nr:translesion error-prone DNA polymerase V autoproteolytic subunit [Paludibacterium paludis]GGY13653.1 SOS (error prone) mutagenesis protein UmuD (RumA) [Paludibacterium paludis]